MIRPRKRLTRIIYLTEIYNTQDKTEGWALPAPLVWKGKKMKKRLCILLVALCLGLAGTALAEGDEDHLPDGDIGGEPEPAAPVVTEAPVATKKPTVTNAPEGPIEAPIQEPVQEPAQEPAQETGLLGELEGAHLPDGDILFDPHEVSPAPTATFPPIEVAAVKERQDMGPVWILVGAMGVVIIILQVILMRMKKK